MMTGRVQHQPGLQQLVSCWLDKHQAAFCQRFVVPWAACACQQRWQGINLQVLCCWTEILDRSSQHAVVSLG